MFLRNSAEGGTAGATVTAANSGDGSGDAFSVVLASSVQFSSPGAHGGLAYTAVAASANTAWNTGTVSLVAVRTYFMLLATPSAAGLFCVVYTGGATTTYAARLLINTSRQVAIQNAAGTQVSALTAHALVLNTWYRVETQVIVGATTSNGSIGVQLFVGDATTSVASYSAIGASNTGTATISRVDVGRLSGTGWSSGPRWDDVAIRDSIEAIGPVSAAGGQFLSFFG